MANKSSHKKLSSTELAQFSNICRSISNDIADEYGFVSVRALLDRFHAGLSIRPLLIEGMLVSKYSGNDDGTNSHGWLVLIDYETYPIADSEVFSEAWGKPLPKRMRFTIAHELVHSLAFRSSEYGIKLSRHFTSEMGKQQLAKTIEQETDRLTPLLLWPENSIIKILGENPSSLTVDECASICSNFGLSRYAFVNRLNLLKESSKDLIQRSALTNLAIGIGKWIDSQRAVFLRWPLYHNFERNILPKILLEVIRGNNTPADVLIGNKTFIADGGSSNTIHLRETDTSSRGGFIPKKMEIDLSIEATGRKPESSFLFAVKKCVN